MDVCGKISAMLKTNLLRFSQATFLAFLLMSWPTKASAQELHSLRFANGSVLTLNQQANQIRFVGVDGHEKTWDGRVDFFESNQEGLNPHQRPSPHRVDKHVVWTVAHSTTSVLTSAFFMLNQTAYSVDQYGQASPIGTPDYKNRHFRSSGYSFFPMHQILMDQGEHYRILGMKNQNGENLILAQGVNGKRFQIQNKSQYHAHYSEFSADIALTSTGRDLRFFAKHSTEFFREGSVELSPLILPTSQYFLPLAPNPKAAFDLDSYRQWAPVYQEIGALQNKQLKDFVALKLKSQKEVELVSSLFEHPEFWTQPIQSTRLVRYQKLSSLADDQLDFWIAEKRQLSHWLNDGGFYFLFSSESEHQLSFIDSQEKLNQAIQGDVQSTQWSTMTSALVQNAAILPSEVDDPLRRTWKYFKLSNAHQLARNGTRLNPTFRADADWAKELNLSVQIKSHQGKAAFMDSSHVAGVKYAAHPTSLFLELKLGRTGIEDRLLEEANRINEILKYREIYLVISTGSTEEVAVRHFTIGSSISQLDYDLCNLRFTKHK